MRPWLRERRAGLLLGGAAVLAVALAVALTGSRARGDLDPQAYDPHGAHALAVLLEHQGVRVVRTTDVPSTTQQAGADATVLVALPELLSPEELALLGQVPGPLVVTGAGPEQLRALARGDAAGVAVAGLGGDARPVAPGCVDPVASRAGRAVVGGFGYVAEGGAHGAAEACYDLGGGAALLRRGRTSLLGTGQPLTNEHLGEEGDAALALGLLGTRPRLVWLVPAASRPALGARPLRSADDLVADWVKALRWQLLVAVVALAGWRARRLGRVVTEQLPVVVRASETVEGHGRLARAAGARDVSASELRAATRGAVQRLAPQHANPEQVVDAVAARAGRAPGAVRDLLYGPTPVDDQALVRLASELDALAHAALTPEGAPR